MKKENRNICLVQKKVSESSRTLECQIRQIKENLQGHVSEETGSKEPPPE